MEPGENKSRKLCPWQGRNWLAIALTSQPGWGARRTLHLHPHKSPCANLSRKHRQFIRGDLIEEGKVEAHESHWMFGCNQWDAASQKQSWSSEDLEQGRIEHVTPLRGAATKLFWLLQLHRRNLNYQLKEELGFSFIFSKFAGCFSLSFCFQIHRQQLWVVL